MNSRPRAGFFIQKGLMNNICLLSFSIKPKKVFSLFKKPSAIDRMNKQYQQ